MLLVSIHAPREGCDETKPKSPPPQECFNSRTPGGVRHEAVEVYADYFCVSIHAPREGCDDDGACRTARGEDVSIHAPREGCDDFYLYPFCVSELVSIHAPREGCDCAIADMSEDAISFNSRTPGGVRLSMSSRQIPPRESFNSRTPGGGRQQRRR